MPNTNNKMKQFIILLMLLPLISFGQQTKDLTNLISEQKKEVVISLRSHLSNKLLNQNDDLRKDKVLYDGLTTDQIKPGELILGSSLIAIMDYQKTSEPDKFGWLMRHPTATNQIGNVVTEAALHSWQFSLLYRINNWMTAYSEILYNPMQSFGSGVMTTLDRNQLQLRRGFVQISNPEKIPFYLSIGKKDTPFGLMNSVSPFTNSTMWHTFGGLGFMATLGLDYLGLNASYSLIQGGRSFRGLNTVVGEGTNVPSRLNNFTIDVNYKVKYRNSSWKLGYSYLKGSAYYHEFPVFHFDPGNIDNPAYTYYSELKIDEVIRLKGSFGKTLKEWPGTFNPNPPLNVFPANTVSSTDYGGSIKFFKNRTNQLILSGEFSEFRAGPKGSPWERQSQTVIGLSFLTKNHSKVFVEYFNAQGYVPLNFVSGSADFEPFPPGVTHSQSDVILNGIVFGVIANL